MSKIRLGIIGAGNIASKHLEVIHANDAASIAWIHNRTKSKAIDLADKFKIPSIIPRIDADAISKVDALMIFVSAENMYEVAKSVLPFGKPTFLEKPPSLTLDRAIELESIALKNSTPTMVGFNRRFYSVFKKGLERLKEKSTIHSILIEGHERFWKISGGNYPSEVTKSWIFANATHTIDLLRYFGGEITSMSGFSTSQKKTTSDNFAYSFNFQQGIIGQYFASWWAPGGWSVKIFGDGLTLEFSPLEKARIIDTDFNSIIIEPEWYDVKFKPGFYMQFLAFLELIKSASLNFPAQSISDSVKTMKIANHMNENKA